MSRQNGHAHATANKFYVASGKSVGFLAASRFDSQVSDPKIF